jgi:hypothetical protein
MEMRRAHPSELNKIVDIMIESGEWDEWKLSYLKENWTGMLLNLKKLLYIEDLGEVYVIEEDEKIIGAIPFIRIGKASLFFACAGILPEYKEEAMRKIDEELFDILPSRYKIIMNYTRPTSTGVVPRFLKEMGIKNAREMYKEVKNLPNFIQRSIKISPPYWYMEKKIETHIKLDRKITHKEKCKNKSKACIERYLMKEFIKAYDIFERREIEELYRKYGLTSEMIVLQEKEACGILLNYPFGLTPSGYLNSTYLLGERSLDLLEKVEKCYSTLNQERILLFIPEEMRNLFEKKGYQPVKLLHQVFYYIEENRKWRSRHKELI